MTVRSWSKPLLAGVELTVAEDRTAGAVAFHTSLSPGCPLDRLTRVQVRPAPLTVTVCPAALFGPSAETKASSVSPAAAVWNAGVVTFPAPRALARASMTKQVIGGAGFCTVTVTCWQDLTLPLVSVACADTTCVPELTAVVSQLMAYGDEVTGLPTFWPSTRNCTEATATLSEALAASGVVAETVSFWVGLVMLTVGGVVSLPPPPPPETTVTVIGVAVATFPEESVTRALRVWLPSGVLPTVHVRV